MRLEGQRAASYTEKSQRIEIHLDRPINSLDDAQTVLNRVFFLEGDAAKHYKPEFRRADDNTPADQIFHVSERAFGRPGDNAPEAAADNDKEAIVSSSPSPYTP